MTSEERHELRYRRRRAKREAKRQKLLDGHRFEDVISRNALAKAAQKATLGVGYKESVQRYMMRRMTNVAIANDKLLHHKDVRKGFICFSLIERGKKRDIMSIHFSERVPQKSLNVNALVPVLMNSVIYDNCANQKGKGTSFAMERLVHHLRQHYRHHGNEGYVIVIDFKNYFGNIDHARMESIVAKAFDDPGIIWMTNLFIDAYYEFWLRKAKRDHTDPAAVKRVGLGLGSEPNQTLAVVYRNHLDHFVKEVLRVKHYIVYNDDSIIIHESKAECEYILSEIRKKCAEDHIEINEKKTGIVKLSHGFRFLKNNIYLTETGKIIKKPCREGITRERRKLKKQAGLFEAGIMSIKDVQRSYESWRSSLDRKDARRTVHNMDCLYNKLFIEDFLKGGGYHD